MEHATTRTRTNRNTYQNVNLTTEDILGFLEVVVRRTAGPSLDLVEARGEVCWRFGLCADRVEIGRDGVLALGQRDEFVASALDHSERNHFE